MPTVQCVNFDTSNSNFREIRMHVSIRRATYVVVAAALGWVGVAGATSALTSCSNFLAIDQIEYTRSEWNNEATFGRTLTENDLGAEFRRVEHNGHSFNAEVKTPQPSGSNECGRWDNFSTDLPIGTPLLEVRGYSPTFRLAAPVEDGFIVLFEVVSNPLALTGADLFDIADRVASVRVIDREQRTLAVIDDPAAIARLVGLMIAAPVAEPEYHDRGWPLIVLYHLTDGTVADDLWYPRSGKLLSGVQASDEYSEMLREALAEAA